MDFYLIKRLFGVNIPIVIRTTEIGSQYVFFCFFDKTAAIERFLAILVDIIKNCIWTVNQQNLSFRSVNHGNPII